MRYISLRARRIVAPIGRRHELRRARATSIWCGWGVWREARIVGAIVGGGGTRARVAVRQIQLWLGRSLIVLLLRYRARHSRQSRYAIGADGGWPSKGSAWLEDGGNGRCTLVRRGVGVNLVELDVRASARGRVATRRHVPMLLAVLSRALHMMLLLIVAVARGTPLGGCVLRWLLRWLAHGALRSCRGGRRGSSRA